MKTVQKIKEGDWFSATEGLAIADKIYDFYFEEFDKIPQGNKVGDYKMSVVQYWLFCDFDGKSGKTQSGQNLQRRIRQSHNSQV